VAHPSLWVSGVCYRLVSEILVETLGRYGSGLLVRVSWLRSNSNREVEKLRRNGIVKSMEEIKHQISFVRVRRIMTVPFELGSNHHCGIKNDIGSWDQREGEKGSSDESEAKVKSQLSDLIGERSTTRRHFGDSSCKGVNSPRKSHNPNHGLTKGLCHIPTTKIKIFVDVSMIRPSKCLRRSSISYLFPRLFP
jgi:hypothetical protein